VVSCPERARALADELGAVPIMAEVDGLLEDAPAL
jgi:hypothetical protein